MARVSSRVAENHGQGAGRSCLRGAARFLARGNLPCAAEDSRRASANHRDWRAQGGGVWTADSRSPVALQQWYPRRRTAGEEGRAGFGDAEPAGGGEKLRRNWADWGGPG